MPGDDPGKSPGGRQMALREQNDGVRRWSPIDQVHPPIHTHCH